MPQAAPIGGIALGHPLGATGSRTLVTLVHASWCGSSRNARRNRMSRLLKEGCPGMEFLPARLMDQPDETEALLQSDAEVDGYLVCVQGLGWGNDIVKLCGTGKPTLLVDNLFGGSGLFLTREARGTNAPTEFDGTCEEDEVPMPDFDRALRQLAEVYANAPLDHAEYWADRWMKRAAEVVEPDRAEIEKPGALNKAMTYPMGKHGADGISINCLGGIYGGHLEAYPCLGLAQVNDDGLVGGCEADQMSALTMATMAALVRRPGFISDPVIDTSKNEIVYAHCVAMTHPFGGGKQSPYRIRSHSEDRKGASMQSLLPVGYMTTTLEINPVEKRVLMHQAKTTGNTDNDMACRTKLRGVLQGDIEKLTENWRMGWHRVTFSGDLKPHVTELCGRLKLELIEEA